MSISNSLFGAFALLSTTCFAQKFITEKSEVSFFSDAPLEEIRAVNKRASGLFDISTSDIAFSIPINEFQFKKSLMQQHFNEKYMESDKFPKATFQGKVVGFDKLNKSTQKVTAIGKLTIHGMSREVEIAGTIEPRDGKYAMKGVFTIVLEQFGITRPQLLWQNIAEQVEVTSSFLFKPQ